MNGDLWKEAKHYCIDNKIEYSSFVEQLIREKLNKKR
jgi:hypothetical protein